MPAEYRDPDEQWWGMSLRIRTPMRSTERVPEDAIKTYEDLGEPEFKGKLCLRTSNNKYNQSFVADRIAKRGEADTEKLLRSWMANQPQILGSDVDVLKAIAAGRCDAGLTNHYYLGRILKDEARLPGRARVARPGRRRRAHQPLGRRARQGRRAPRRRGLADGVPHQPAGAGGDRRRTPSWPPTRTCRRPSTSATGPTSSATRSTSSAPGKLLPSAVALMQKVGWK